MRWRDRSEDYVMSESDDLIREHRQHDHSGRKPKDVDMSAVESVMEAAL